MCVSSVRACWPSWLKCVCVLVYLRSATERVCVIYSTISVTCKEFLGKNLSPCLTAACCHWSTGQQVPFFLTIETHTHTHAPHISKYQANDTHKSPHVHIITVDFPLRSHNCSGASRTLEKGFMRCSLWQPMTLAGHKYYCSWWEREHGLIEMRKQASLHWWNKDL